MARSRYLGNAFNNYYRVCVVATKYNDFLNLNIEGDSKVIIDYYNKRNVIYLVQLFF